MSEWPPWLGDYFAERQRERDEGAAATLAALTDREQQLVREAAVMGFVLGSLGGKRGSVPPDAVIVGNVVASCRSASDLYPLLGREPS